MVIGPGFAALRAAAKMLAVSFGPLGFDLGAALAAPLAAVALGAKIIEKHLTLDRNADGPDHKASLNPEEFGMLVKGIRNISIALGGKEKKIGDKELKNLPLVRKSIVAKKDIKEGEVFSIENL